VADLRQAGRHGQIGTTYGIEWGIFVALAAAALLAYSGSRIRAAREAEPPLPGEGDATRPRNGRPRSSSSRPERRPRPAGGEPPPRQRHAPESSAFPTPPPWSGGDVPTFDAHRIGADRRRDEQPPAPATEALTRVRNPPDPHDQPTARLDRADGDSES